MSEHPRLSIGMPVYNSEAFVEQAIRSLLAQTYRDFELVISDNASTDRSLAICERIAAEDPRIVLHRNRINLGAAANFRRVFELSRGEYFKWACADDYCAPELLERCVHVLDSDRDVVLCYGQTVFIDEHGHELGRYSDDLDLHFGDVGARIRRACEHFGKINVLQGVARAETIRTTRGFRDYPGSDLTLMVELALRGQIVELPVSLLFRRMHSQAQSSSATPAERAARLNPHKRRRVFLVMWRLQSEQFLALWRSPIKGRLKLRLTLSLLMSWLRKREMLATELSQVLRGTLDLAFGRLRTARSGSQR